MLNGARPSPAAILCSAERHRSRRDMFGDGELSDDGDAIEWTEIDTDDINFADTQVGFNLTISGIRANAAMVGAGEDIMATVMVGGTVVHSAPLKVADVTEGLVVKADVAEGLQCADTDDAMAVITIQEGFVDAIVSMVNDADDTPDFDEGRIATAWW